MSTAKTIKLNRNLRRSILQGQPWIYANALQTTPSIAKSCLVKILDQKSQFLAWGVYNPSSNLALRVISTDKKEPKFQIYKIRILKALEKRLHLIQPNNNAFRLINGEGDLLPGFICDIYNEVAVIQFDGDGIYDFWNQEELASFILNLKELKLKSVYYKPRHDSKNQPKLWGEPIHENLVHIKELGSQFYVDIKNGQKTGFFLDQRENRNYIKKISKNKKVLNLFSYSGGFSIFAGLGGATSVTSVDIAEEALKLAQENWNLNKLENEHTTETADVFEFVKTHREKYDIVICDPPSLAKSEQHKAQAVEKYVESFANAAKLVHPNGHLVLSSCSSHISFTDFEKIIAEALSRSKKYGQTLRASGQGEDHPYPQACPQLRYLKFFDLVVQ